MNKYCINIRDREVHIIAKEEDMKVLSFVLAESRLVIGFWQEQEKGTIKKPNAFVTKS